MRTRRAVYELAAGPNEERTPGSARALALISAALLLSMTTWFSATAVVPVLREEWALSSTTSAWLTIAVQLGFVIGAVLSSVLNLSDIASPRHLFIAGSVAAALANLMVAFADGAATAIPLRMATGAALALVYPPGLKLVATWFRGGRGLALGTLVGALTLGSAVPHLIRGLGGIDWQVVVVATSLLTAAGAGMVTFAVREGPYPFPAATFDPRQAGRVLRDRAVRLASIGYFGHMWELYAMWSWFAVFFGVVLERSGHESASVAGLATFAVIGVGAAGCVVGGVLGDRVGRARTNAAMLAVSGACSLTIGLLVDAGPWPVLALGLVWGFTVVADSAQFSTLVTEHGNQAYVGTALTLQLAIGFVLTVATIWLLPLLADAVGWRYAFMPLAAGPLIGIAAMVRLARLDAARP